MENEQTIFEKERTPRNLITNFEETLEAMAKIEGDFWLKEQNKEKEHTARWALEYLKSYEGEDIPPIDVYGNGGINRWMVRSDGSVELSKHHATRRGDSDGGDIKKAQELGFNIFY